ncbi:MAG: DUF697 domain-containing protein [Succinivibrionaceae bacterium]|nr:DUF697 domain-containing protein [Succinivibrionaceae bacterium]
MSRNEMKAGFVLEDEPEKKSDPEKSHDQKMSSDRRKILLQEDKPGAEALKRGFELDADAASLEPAEIQSHEVATTIEFEEEEATDVTPARVWTSPVLWILLLITGLGGLQCWFFVSSAFAQNSVAGIVSGTVMLLLLVMALASLWRELKSVLLLKRSDERRLQIREIIKSGSAADAFALCAEMARDSGMLESRQFDSFRHKVKEHFSAADVFALYEEALLRAQDEKARRIIVRRSRENGVIVALSPMAWLDMTFTLARSLRMIREISEIYGLRCGLWGRMQLYRRVIRNIIFIGMADLATDAVTDVLGAGMAGRLSSALGQGIAAGIYSTRLGYMTVKSVRPVDMSSKTMTLSDLRKALLTQGGLADLLKSDGGRK